MAEKISTEDALKKLEAQLECSLCLDYFKEPKLLPCFHAFCKSPCLEKLVSKDGRSLTCPICRHDVELSKKGVAGLQSDFTTARLFEVKEAFDKAKDSDEKDCENCNLHKVTGYCNDCEELLCEECIIVHKNGKKYKTHTLLTLDELKSQATKLKPAKKPPPNCNKHPENPAKIYCSTCSSLICYDCTISLHKEHTFHLVAEIFSKHKQEIVSSLKPVKENLDLVRKSLKAADNLVKRIHKQRATLEADIHKEFDQFQKLLDERRAVLLGELEELTQQKVKELATQRDQVEMTETQLSSCLEYAEGALETGTESEVLAMKAPMMERILQILAEFNPNSYVPKTKADLMFLPHGKQELEVACQDFSQVTVDSNLLSLENSKLELDEQKFYRVGQKEAAIFTPINKGKKTFEGQLKIGAKLSDKAEKNTTKCEVEVQQNGQLKISFTPMKRGEHKLHITANGNAIPGSPFRIAVLLARRVIASLTTPSNITINSKGQILVVNSSGSSVSVLTADGEKMHSFGTKGTGNGQFNHAWGITVDKKDKMYVVNSGDHRVQKFSADGKFLKTVGSQGSDKLHFNCPVGIAYNHKDNLLYVVDQSNHRIQVLTTDLAFVRAFGKKGTGDGDLQCPRGLAFDSANNIYVTDYRSNCVHVLTTSGQFLRSFSDKDGDLKLNKPWAIAISSSDKVYIGEEGSKCVSAFTSQGDYKGLMENVLSLGLAFNSNNALIMSDYVEDCLCLY